MKKLITVLSALSLTCSLCGCNLTKSPEELSDSHVYQIATEAKSDTPVAAEVVQPFIDYFDGFNNNDVDMVVSTFTPQAIIDSLKENETYDSLRTQTESDITDTMEYWCELYGANPKASYVGEVSNTPLTAQQLGFAELYFKYAFYDADAEIEIEEGYEVTFKYNTIGESDSVEAEETACFVKVKDDGWKMITTTAAMLNQFKDAGDPNED